MKQILALNAFEAKDTATLPDEVRTLVGQRNAVMGAGALLMLPPVSRAAADVVVVTSRCMSRSELATTTAKGRGNGGDG